MRKIYRKMIALFIVVTIVTNIGLTAQAHELDNMAGVEVQDYEEPIIEANEEIQEFITSSEPCNIPFEFDNSINNEDIENIDGFELGSIDEISDLDNIPARLADIPPNTDPNNAYGLSPNTEYSGIITKEGEVRWYAFDISTMTKVSMLIKAENNMDTDIFLFKLDTNTMMLESTNLSAINSGSEEYFSCVIGEGIYFFAVLGSVGSGTFILDFFENANYVDSEINDSVANAQIMGSEKGFTGGSVTGIIDTMRDVDYYKLVLTTPTVVNIKFSSPQNHVMKWVNTDSSADRLSYSNGDNILAAGEHYFVVYNTKGEFFSGVGTYTVTIDVIVGNVTKDFNASGYIRYPEYQAILQFYPNRTRYFLNGIEINMNCGFSRNYGSNPNNSEYRKWSIHLYRVEGLIFNVLGYKTFYNSIAEEKKYTKVYFIEIGSEDGQTIFGSRFTQKGTVQSMYNVTYAIVAVDAITGMVVDIIDPDPNPYDGITPSM